MSQQITFDLNDLATQASDADVQRVKDAAGRLAMVIQEIGLQAGTSDAKVALLNALAEMARTGSVQVEDRQPLALAAGSTSSTTAPSTTPATDVITPNQAQVLVALARSTGVPDVDTFLSRLGSLFGPLASATQAQQAQRFTLAEQVLNGQFVVSDLGVPAIEEERDRLVADLRQANTALRQMTTARDQAVAFKDQFGPNTIPASLIAAMKRIADGSMPVDANGHVRLPANHPTVQERDTANARAQQLEQERDTANALLRDIRDNATKARTSNDQVVHVNDLDRGLDTRRVMGW